MNVKEELDVIQMWFDTIRKEATTKRNTNGVLLSDSRTLEEIALHAEDGSEYIEMLLIKEAFEFFAPEPAESEDERIRNLIYCLIRDRSDNRKLLEHNGVSVDKALAYLEKQKEQAWSEESKRKLNRIYEILGQAADERPFGSSKRIIGDKEAVELQDFIKSLRPQTKQEWNEEDKRRIVELKTFIAQCNGFNKENRQKAFDMIDALRPQPKQEWSEEDEILRVRTINRLETLNFHGISGKEIRESIDWLKSLRPSWKPSEKQEEPEYYQHFDPDC